MASSEYLARVRILEQQLHATVAPLFQQYAPVTQEDQVLVTLETTIELATNLVSQASLAYDYLSAEYDAAKTDNWEVARKEAEGGRS